MRVWVELKVVYSLLGSQVKCIYEIFMKCVAVNSNLLDVVKFVL